MTKQQFQVAIPAQKNFTFAWFFMPIYLVNSNNCVNTHTHTQERDQYKGTRDARVIYNIITYKQRVCKKFFINFLHALFRGKNRAVCAQKLCIAVTQNNNKFK